MSRKLALISRTGLIRLAWLGLIIFVALTIAIQAMFVMPRKSYQGEFAALNKTELKLQNNLEQDINILANKIGVRNYLNYEGLKSAVDFIDASFSKSGYLVEHRLTRVVLGIKEVVTQLASS